jgi:hypothetical protein
VLTRAACQTQLLTGSRKSWRAAGFDMPNEGEPFDWYKYLAYVATGAPEPGDLIQWLDDKKDVIGYMRPHKVKIPSNGIEM